MLWSGMHEAATIAAATSLQRFSLVFLTCTCSLSFLDKAQHQQRPPQRLKCVITQKTLLLCVAIVLAILTAAVSERVAWRVFAEFMASVFHLYCLCRVLGSQTQDSAVHRVSGWVVESVRTSEASSVWNGFFSGLCLSTHIIITFVLCLLDSRVMGPVQKPLKPWFLIMIYLVFGSLVCLTLGYVWWSRRQSRSARMGFQPLEETSKRGSVAMTMENDDETPSMGPFLAVSAFQLTAEPEPLQGAPSLDHVSNRVELAALQRGHEAKLLLTTRDLIQHRTIDSGQTAPQAMIITRGILHVVYDRLKAERAWAPLSIHNIWDVPLSAADLMFSLSYLVQGTLQRQLQHRMSNWVMNGQVGTQDLRAFFTTSFQENDRQGLYMILCNTLEKLLQNVWVHVEAEEYVNAFSVLMWAGYELQLIHSSHYFDVQKWSEHPDASALLKLRQKIGSRLYLQDSDLVARRMASFDCPVPEKIVIDLELKTSASQKLKVHLDTLWFLQKSIGVPANTTTGAKDGQDHKHKPLVSSMVDIENIIQQAGSLPQLCESTAAIVLADSKSRFLISRFLQNARDAFVSVCGCSPADIIVPLLPSQRRVRLDTLDAFCTLIHAADAQHTKSKTLVGRQICEQALAYYSSQDVSEHWESIQDETVLKSTLWLSKCFATTTGDHAHGSMLAGLQFSLSPCETWAEGWADLQHLIFDFFLTCLFVAKKWKQEGGRGFPPHTLLSAAVWQLVHESRGMRYILGLCLNAQQHKVTGQYVLAAQVLLPSGVFETRKSLVEYMQKFGLDDGGKLQIEDGKVCNVCSATTVQNMSHCIKLVAAHIHRSATVDGTLESEVQALASRVLHENGLLQLIALLVRTCTMIEYLVGDRRLDMLPLGTVSHATFRTWSLSTSKHYFNVLLSNPSQSNEIKFEKVQEEFSVAMHLLACALLELEAGTSFPSGWARFAGPKQKTSLLLKTTSFILTDKPTEHSRVE